MSGHKATFTSTIHADVSPSIDPSNVRLLPGFTVLILGASRGIGASIARSYATAGASTLILTARDASSIESTAASCRDIQPQLQVLCEACDVSSAPSIAALAESVKSKTSRLDVIVMNSGYSGPVVLDVTKGEPADFKRAMDINALGTYYAAHYLLPLLFESSESAKAFLVVSASAAWITEGPIANIGYCVSKLAQMRFVEMVSKQFEGRGLLAVGIHPGAVRTEMAEGAPEEFKKCGFCACKLKTVVADRQHRFNR